MEINWNDVLKVLGMVLVVEGIMPFLFPAKWRSIMLKIASQKGSELRAMGLFSMILGLIVISLI